MKRWIALPFLMLAGACASSGTSAASGTREGAVNGGFAPPTLDALMSRICPSFIDETDPSAARVLAPERATPASDAAASNVLCLRARVGQNATCSTNGSRVRFANVGMTIVGCGDKSTVYAIDVVP